MKLLFKPILFLTISVAIGATPLLAETVVIDENGLGFFNGQQMTTCTTCVNLTYNAGFFTTADFTPGDVLIGPAPGDPPCTDFSGYFQNACDVVGFSVGSIVFNSSTVPDGADTRADQGFPPGLAPVVNATEIGSESNNATFYTPTSGQPGFIAGMNLTYVFVSDGQASPTITPPVPEPASLALLGTGLLGLLALRKKK